MTQIIVYTKRIGAGTKDDPCRPNFPARAENMSYGTVYNPAEDMFLVVLDTESEIPTSLSELQIQEKEAQAICETLGVSLPRVRHIKIPYTEI